MPAPYSSDLTADVRDAVRAARLAYVFNGQPASLFVASQMQGSIGYHGEPGASATFFVELPEASTNHASAA